MKGYREIKRILVEEWGFRDLASYQKWIAEERPKTRPTKDAIERLSPDKIDNRAFWKVCDELFGSDPVCNVAVSPEVGRMPFNVESAMDANRLNLRLAKSFAITSFLEENAHARLRVLEIGAGYGSLKHFIETATNHLYAGVDAVPRVPGILESTQEGSLPHGFVDAEKGKYSYVISTNVFQHLSSNQRERYVKDASALLHEGGLFIFNLTVDTSQLPAFARDSDGTAWAFHYGQYTPIPKQPEAYALTSDAFNILYVTQRYDGLFNFVCQKR